MSGRRLLIVSILGILLTACASSSSSSPSPSASIAGRCCPPQEEARVVGSLVGVGGPARTAVRHWSGTIHAKGPERRAFLTDGDGGFSATLMAGTYRFTATSPSYDGGQGECSARGAVQLRSHRTTHVRVVCQLK